MIDFLTVEIQNLLGSLASLCIGAAILVWFFRSGKWLKQEKQKLDEMKNRLDEAKLDGLTKEPKQRD